MPDLHGKAAIVAAASGGLAKATAQRLAELGADVTICSRDAGRIEAAAHEIEQATGRNILAVQADVNEAAHIEAVVQQTISAYGKVDILVTSSGGPPSGLFEQFEDEAWMKAHQQNLLSVVRFVRSVLPSMKENGSGSILNIVSTSVKQPISGLILSNTYRSAVAGLAKTLADELAPYNIRVNNIAPGRIATERINYLDEMKAKNDGTTVEAATQFYISTIPLGRYGTPLEFANAAAFLVSEEASYITGVTLQIDGGHVRTLT